MKIFISLILLLYQLFYGQEVPQNSLRKEIETLYYTRTSNADDTYSLGEKIVQLSKNETEFSKGYILIADALNKKGNYSKAVYYYKKVDSLSDISNNYSDKITANFFLSAIYKRLSLKKQSQAYFIKVKTIANTIKTPEILAMSNELEAILLMEDLKYCEAIQVKNAQINFDKKSLEKNNSIENVIYYGIDNITLSFCYLKCGNDTKAQFYLTEYEKILKIVPQSDIKYLRLSLYFLNKAIIYAEANQRDAAKYWFNKAYADAVKNKNTLYIMRVIEEEMHYAILDPKLQKAHFDQYIRQKQILRSHAEKIIAQEESQQGSGIASVRIVILIGSLLIIALFILFNKKIRLLFGKKTSLPYNKVKSIQAIEYELSTEILEKDDVSSGSEKKESIIMMSKEREEELLDKIKKFEEGILYTEKNFSMAQMALVLDSNAKYINYILQKYRGKTFSDYVNELRIKFIVKNLEQKSEYLNYKINYLSEISGFSSHSRFTYIFKKELNISPSEFISNLREKKNN
ncbi:helix-turn-helix domain-containing protein [Chryseobacterium herbae]|uniref:Helix-turn-helix domain-containing protein n=1 Tax=Chryseobacterium herbae TaxID=2976476 RepID=A0ABT2ITH1_9FLAO|nr:helix-turn-helix domain-containing protein [Chryseobacterium sp. pc1-10]MCT2562082.1 helix-turn-helix domain-containing protein [Chryseobacterium sp. pc1-10]